MQFACGQKFVIKASNSSHAQVMQDSNTEPTHPSQEARDANKAKLSCGVYLRCSSGI